MFDYDRHLTRRENARSKADDRAYDRLTKLADAADAMIGELVREGKQVFYINVRSKAGALTGKVREFSLRVSATDFLIRNQYV